VTICILVHLDPTLVKFKGRDHRSKDQWIEIFRFAVTDAVTLVTLPGNVCILKRQKAVAKLLLVVSRIICAKMVGMTSSKGFLANIIIVRPHRSTS